MNAESVADGPRPRSDLTATVVSVWRLALACAVAGALFAMLVPPAIDAVRELVRSPSQDRAAARSAAAWPTPELPRQWRWSPPGVQVDHMFRRPR